MTQEQYNKMVKIFNILCTINTHGEDTLNMADCLRNMKEVLENVDIIEKEDK